MYGPKKTVKIEDGPIAYFDVDDTLVMWEPLDPATDSTVEAIPFLDPNDGSTIFLQPHRKHIKMLKRHALSGHKIVVWSHGGSDWAEAVVDQLNLRGYVDVIMSKPSWYYDDLPAGEFLPGSSRKYFLDKKWGDNE